MKKLIFIIPILFSLVGFSQSDESSDGYKGFSIEMFGSIQFNYQPDNDLTIPFYGFGFNPRYNFYAPQDYLSFSAGMPINLGIEAYGSTGGSAIQFFTDVPAEISFNIGDRATSSGEYYFGGFLGAGINYNYASYRNSFGFNVNSHAVGPMVSGGLRYRYLQRPVGIRVSYMHGLINNFKEDPCNCIEYANGTSPKILTLSIIYGVY